MNTRIRNRLVQKGRSFVESEPAPPEKPFFKWFWENVLGYSSEEYRREFWREAYRYGHTIGPMPKTFGTRMGRTVYGFEMELGQVIFGTFVLGLPATFFYLIRLAIRQYLKRLRRPSYYERERLRRLELGRRRRSILSRSTLNAKPSIEAIRTAWNGARHSPEGALRLGGLLEDLECFVNNGARGNAVEGYRGRYGGIKRLLEEQAPDLFPHYAALMRYKSIARKFRQACALNDPIPADAVIPLPEQTAFGMAQGKDESKTTKTAKKLPHGSNFSSQSGTPQAKRGKENPLIWSDQNQNCPASPLIASDPNTRGQANSLIAPVANRRGQTNSLIAPVANKRGQTNSLIASDSKVVVDGIAFPKLTYAVEDTARKTALRIFRACENSVISLEAALALEIDPNCIEDKTDAKRRTAKSGPTKSSERISRRVREWIRKRCVA